MDEIATITGATALPYHWVISLSILGYTTQEGIVFSSFLKAEAEVYPTLLYSAGTPWRFPRKTQRFLSLSLELSILIR
jgi:hypothetical protein